MKTLLELEDQLQEEARKLARALQAKRRPIVLVEAGTGGIASAALTRASGSERCFLGSIVLSDPNTLQEWLDVPRGILESSGMASAAVAKLIADRALRRSSDAWLCVSIAGGFHSPACGNADGKVFIGVGARDLKTPWAQQFWLLPSTTQSTKRTQKAASDVRARRLLLASHLTLFMVRSLLESTQKFRS